MPLVTTTEMFKKAYDNGYAIGAFNVNNMEIVQGITSACKKLNAPVILQVSSGARKYAHHDYLVKMVEAAWPKPASDRFASGSRPDFETCKSCIDGGFTSVMIDGSSKPYEENVELTRKVVEYAHAHGVVVEASLVSWQALKMTSMFLPTMRISPSRKRWRISYPARALTPSPSPSAQAMVHISSSPVRSRSCALTSSLKWRKSCPASQSFCTVRVR